MQPNGSDKLDSFSAMKQNPMNSNLLRAPMGAPQNPGDIIDISDADDDDVVSGPVSKPVESIAKAETNGTKPVIDPLDQPYKEKTVYKPNLVKRRPKPYPPMPETSPLGSFDRTFHNKAQEWTSMKPYTLGSSQSQTTSNRAANYLPTGDYQKFF